MLKCQAIGNLGSDPELRYSASGSPFLTFNVATNGRTRDQTGEWVDCTEWVRVRVLGQRAESLANLLHKGTKVYVDGRLEARPWNDRNNAIRAGLEVLADNVEFMSPRQDDQVATTQPSRAVETRTPGGAGAGRPSRSVPDDVGDLEDLPF